ncbi:terminase gpP N-terminus-related DNA-binding protein [Profundibacter sp.]
MTKTSLVTTHPKPPAQIEAYVEVLGVDLTVEFLLSFGGAELYIGKNPGDKSRLVKLVGPERAKALGRITERLQRRVPLEKPWTARFLSWKGCSIAEIARKLHVSDVSVRSWLKSSPQERQVCGNG